MAKSIIVCEDQSMVRNIISEHLQSAGFTVQEACNGSECLELTQKAPPDAIILDIVMPIMDGITTLRKLREQKVDVPVIVLTGYAQMDFRSEILELGVDGFLSKPFRPFAISAMLDRVMLERAVARTSGQRAT